MSTRRRRSNLLFAAASLVLACAKLPPSETDPVPLGKLPAGIRPLHYELELSIDPALPRFSGVARIRIELDRPTRTIWLHGERLSVSEVTVAPSGAAAQSAAWEVVAEPGVAAIRLAQSVGPGTAELTIAYDAAFGDRGRGLDRVDSDGDAYAFTHFEPLSARRAFPGFDEPRFKTPFDVTLIVSPQHIAVANTPILEESDAPGGRRRFRFAPTQPLPTFLVAWAVGPLDITPVTLLPAHGNRNQPLSLRGIAIRGGASELGAALERVRPLLEHLEDYLGSPYPFAKLDLVAVPGFGPGAMENPGLVFFRDEFLLLDRPDATENRRRFDYVLSHELVHQWFGNLVTIPWWDDIWLSEALATWLGRRTQEAVHPEDEANGAFQVAVDRAMAQDALAESRSIRQPIETRHDVYNAFDAITYDKGSALLAMFEHWLGPENFRAGLRRTLATHRLKTATTADLLAALSGGGRDAATPFQTFLSQAGVPLIEAESDCNETGGGIRVRQSRYVPLGSSRSRRAEWQIPVCIRHGTEGRVGETCELLTAENARIRTGDACPTWFMPNAGAVGYYRFALNDDDWRNLRDDGWTHLSERERRSVANNIEAGFRAGKRNAAATFSEFEALAADDDPRVARAPMPLLELAGEHLVPSGERGAVERFSSALYARRLERIGWDAKPGESVDTLSMRPPLIRFLALRAREGGVRREAERRGRLFAGLAGGPRDGAALEPNLVEIALAVVVQEGSATEFDTVLALFRESKELSRRRAFLRALASTQDPALAARARALSLDPALHPQEVWTPLYRQSQVAETRAGAWEFITAHFDELVERAGRASSGWMPWLASGFCNTERAAEVEAFLASRMHRIDGGPRNLAGSLESIRLCSALAAEQGPASARFFRTRP